MSVSKRYKLRLECTQSHVTALIFYAIFMILPVGYLGSIMCIGAIIMWIMSLLSEDTVEVIEEEKHV